MSDFNVGVVRAGMSLDLAQLRRQIEQATSQMKKLTVEVQRATSMTQQQITSAQDRELRKQIDQQARAAARQNEIVKRAVQRDVAEFEKASQARVRAFEKEMREQQRLMQQQQQARQKNIQKFTTGAQNFGNTALGVAAPVVGGFAAAAREAVQFESAMRNVDSIAHLTDQQFQSLNRNMLSLAKDDSIRQMPTDLAKGLYQVYSAGQEGAKALKTLEWGAKGASAGLTDTETSTRVLLAVMNSGIKGFQDQKEAMDILFQEVNLGVNSFGELANSLGNVLPIASMMGVSLQEISAGMVVMTRAGIGAEESVTALNQLLTHIAKPGQEAERMMTQLGIAYGSGALEAQGLAGWLEQVIQKTKGNKDEIMHLIPEIRGSKALMSLLADGIKGYNNALADMKGASKGAGQAQEALNRQNKSVSAQWDLLKKNISLVGIEIGNTLLPSMQKGISALRAWLEKWNALPDATKQARIGFAETVTKIVAFTGAISIASGAVVTLIGNVSNLVKLLTGARGLAAGLGGLGLGAIGGGAWLIGDSGLKWGAAVEEQSKAEAMLANTPDTSRLDKANSLWRTLAENERQQKSKLYGYKGMLNDKEILGIKQKINRLMSAQMRSVHGGTKAEMDAMLAEREFLGNYLNLPEVNKFDSNFNKPAAGGGAGKTLPGLNAGGYNRDDFKAKKKGRNGRSEAEREMESNLREYTQQTEELLRLRLGESSARIYRIHQEYMEALKNPFMKKRAGSVMAGQLKEVYDGINKATAEAQKEKQARFNDTIGSLSEVEIGLPTDPSLLLQDKRERNLSYISAIMAGVGRIEESANSVRQFNEARQDADRQMQDYMVRLRYDTGLDSVSTYTAYLKKKMEDSRVMGEPTKNTYEIWKQMVDLQGETGKNGMRRFSEEFEQSRQMAENAMRNVSAGMMNILGNSFRKAFKGDFGEMFGNILFNLLSDVISNAITSAFKKSTKGGKGLGVGGAIGATLDIFSMFGFGFDDAANDRTAHGWGWDFAKHFGNGVKQFQNRQADFVPTRAAAGGTNNVNVTVNLSGQSGDMDYGELGRRVAWEVQKELRRTV